MDNLKNCPFCGYKAELSIKNDNTTNHNTKIRVGCINKDCQLHFEDSLYGRAKKSIMNMKAENLIKKWNRRI